MAHKRWRLLAILVLAFALVAAACGDDDDTATTTAAPSDGGETTETTAAASDGEAMKVALVLVGPVSDKGWSWAHEQGTQFLEITEKTWY